MTMEASIHYISLVRCHRVLCWNVLLSHIFMRFLTPLAYIKLCYGLLHLELPPAVKERAIHVEHQREDSRCALFPCIASL